MFSKLPFEKIMGIMTKYQDIDLEKVNINIDIYDDALVMKVLTDSSQVGEMFADFLPIIFTQIPKENLKVTDHRG